MFITNRRARAAAGALALGTGAFALGAGSAAPAMAGTYTARNAAQLVELLGSVRAESTILLAPGTYGDVTLRDLRLPARVTIRSADPARRAKFGRVIVRDSANMRFDQLEFRGARRAGENFTVSSVLVRSSDAIDFTSCHFAGTLNSDPNDDGILLRYMMGSSGAIVNSRFREARVAISLGDSAGVAVVSNEIRMAREGMNLSGMRDVVIDRNLFADIRPNVAAGDHADAIQLFSGAVPAQTRAVAITNNAFLLGGTTTQGLFVRNESGDPRFDPADLSVENNVYFGGVRHAFTFNNVRGAALRRNTVAFAPGMVVVPSINVFDSVGVVLDRNITPLVIKDVAVAESGTVLTESAKGEGVDPAAQFVGVITRRAPAVDAFRVRPGSAAAARGAGFTPVEGIGGTGAAGAEAAYREALRATGR